MVTIGQRCEVQFGSNWYPCTVSGVGLGPDGTLVSVNFDIQGARCNVTEEKLRPLPEAQLSLGDA